MQQPDVKRFFNAQRTHETEQMLVVKFRNAVATCVCCDCFEKVDLHVSMKPEGLNLQLRQKSSIILVTK